MNKKGGLADSPFFHMPQASEVQSPVPQKPTQETKPEPAPPPQPKRTTKKAKVSSNRDTMTPRHHDTSRDTTLPRYHDAMVEVVRKSVKEFGKEAATHRFTLEEKKAVADIIYAYKGRSIKTSENEIARIAINFVINDYEENGENSILHKVLDALNT